LKQLRKAFPTQVTPKTVEQWGFAPKNETYVIGVLRYLGIVDDDGNKLQDASKIFSIHGDKEFGDAFGALVRARYEGLFEVFGDDSWELDQDRLIAFFRSADESSEAVGKRQARTFQALAGLAGKTDSSIAATPVSKKSTSTKPKANAGQKAKPKTKVDPAPKDSSSSGVDVSQLLGDRKVGLTVRIELNLPATTDQKVYDGIFKSIRQHLIDE
jgi:hypothetical protein